MNIVLTKGRTAIIDDDDFERMSVFKWSYSDCGYAMRGTTKGGKFKGFYLHREILNAPTGIEIDHINGDKLDNRKSNLRLCDHRQNSWNCKARKTNKLGVKGVCKHRGRYKAQICIYGTQFTLGTFDTLQEARSIYNDCAEARAKGLFQ